MYLISRIRFVGFSVLCMSLPLISEELLVANIVPPRFGVESSNPIAFDVTTDDGEGDVEGRASVALALPEIDTNGPPPD